MRLSIKGTAGAFGVFWGGSVLIVGILNLITPGYGEAFLEICASLYPGYELTGTWSSVLIGTGYGLVDGAVCGAIFAWLYNRFAPGTQ